LFAPVRRVVAMPSAYPSAVCRQAAKPAARPHQFNRQKPNADNRGEPNPSRATYNVHAG